LVLLVTYSAPNRDSHSFPTRRSSDLLRQRVNGDEVSYVVTRNINYTNICYFRCQFCAFSKGKLSENLRGRPYNLDLSLPFEKARSEEHTSELQSRSDLVCRLLLEKKK